MTTSEAAPTAERSGTEAGQPAHGWSDRVLGVVALGIGLWYTIEARTFDGTSFGAGPVGPKTLPTGVGILFMALSTPLIVRRSQAARWPSRSAGWQMALVALMSYGYGRVMEPIGFVIASAAMMTGVGLLFRARPVVLVPCAIAFPIVLSFAFTHWLQLNLPDGWWGGL